MPAALPPTDRGGRSSGRQGGARGDQGSGEEGEGGVDRVSPTRGGGACLVLGCSRWEAAEGDRCRHRRLDSAPNRNGDRCWRGSMGRATRSRRLFWGGGRHRPQVMIVSVLLDLQCSVEHSRNNAPPETCRVGDVAVRARAGRDGMNTWPPLHVCHRRSNKRTPEKPSGAACVAAGWRSTCSQRSTHRLPTAPTPISISDHQGPTGTTGRASAAPRRASAAAAGGGDHPAVRMASGVQRSPR